MGFTVAEAAFLVERGFDDILVAYPTVQTSDARRLGELNGGEAVVSIVVDSPEHLARLEEGAAEVGGTVPVIVEVDMSWRPLGVSRPPRGPSKPAPDRGGGRRAGGTAWATTRT